MGFEVIHLGSKLEAERKRRGLTQQEVGEGIGSSGSYISQLERSERKPSLETYLGLIKFFGVEFSYFLDENTDDREIIGREIKSLREKRGLSIGQLRDLSRVDFFRIGKAENGELELTDEELQKLAEVLEVSVDYFHSRFDYNISKIVSALQSLQVSDSDIKLVLEFVHHCLEKEKHP